MNNNNQELTVKEAANRLGISLSLMYLLCQSDAIRHTRYGRPGIKRPRIKLTASAVEEYRRSCERGPGRD